jgi:hypothetical protein
MSIWSTGKTVSLASIVPQSLQIWGTDRPGKTEPLVSISMADGSIKFGADYTEDKAARAFWEAIGRNYRATEAA